ncbi:MAG: hypothetical protein K6U02_02890 [Firmicutes bacterium]|nr:hypothetical protein [Bacillota bacterium]
MNRTPKKFLAVGVALLLLGVVVAQQPAPEPATQAPAAAVTAQEILAQADRVLVEVSQLITLEIKRPLRKSIRTREEIRAYLVKEFQEDEEPAKRYADARLLEKWGLIPKGFPLETFLLDLLTEQVIGIYDPKAQEFMVADWISSGDVESVVVHELTHALQDQHFQLEPWVKAARPNDDAQLARTAVLEGSAMAAMLDYAFRAMGVSLRVLPDLTPFLDQLEMGDQNFPLLASAPPYLADVLIFPYRQGLIFSQAVLREVGWSEFSRVFANPPMSSQQILHPERYFSGYVPEPVPLPKLTQQLPEGWNVLDENVLGEFGLLSLLKQHLGEQTARQLAPAWDGDRYAIAEHAVTRQVLLVFRLRLAGEGAKDFFPQYAELLRRRYASRQNEQRSANFLSFDTGEAGGVFLYCTANECLSVEGADRATFDRIADAFGWPAAPVGVSPRQWRELSSPAAAGVR